MSNIMMPCTGFCYSDSPPSNTYMKPACWSYAERRMNSTPTSCSAGGVRPLLLADMNESYYRFRNPLLAVYPPASTMQDGRTGAYPSTNCKPVPLEAIISSALVQSEKVLDEDDPAPKSWSLRDTFEDQNSASTMTRTVSPPERKNNKPEAIVLPIDFSPHPCSVICGRGKMRTDAPGNRYLQSIAARYMLKYSQARSKREKSSIVSNILEIVRGAIPDGRGAFIRTEKNRWTELSDLVAREKISSVMRNGLHSKYRSSTKSKVAKRRYQKALKEEIRIIEDGGALLSPVMAFSDALCSKYEPADPTNKYDDEVFDLLGGEDLFMEGFFE
jgi:hypothetical protein